MTKSDSITAPIAHSSKPFWQKLSQIVTESGRTYFSVLIEIATLRYGPGKLSFDEYIGLRLYDDQLYAGVNKKTFVGFKALQRFWVQANYRFDFYGLVNNKIATDILLGTYGFPIMPTIGIFHEHMGRQSSFILRNEDELRSFLKKPEHYPLFSKPMNGHQSHGSASLEYYDAAHNRMITTMRHGIPVDTFIAYVKAHAASGYIFQKRVSPHATIRKICGDRLATVRLLTILENGQPKVLRACWKIPAGKNTADNFWRPGNLLAQLDIESGRVLRVVRSKETGFEEITHHPDTDASLLELVLPNWKEAVSLAIEGAKVLQDIALIGWDIALVDSGVIIVETNETPDFKIHQLADRRGMIDNTFMHFIEQRKQHAKNWLRNSQNKKRNVAELIPPLSPTESSSPPGPEK